MKVPRVSPQAGKGGAELPQLGAQARYVQDAIGQSGAPVDAVANTQASGTVTVADNAKVAAADTLTVGATVLTFVANGATPGDGEVEVGSDAGGTRDNILAALGDAEDVTVEASSTAAITVTAVAAGTAGNDIGLAVTLDEAGGITVSGAKLSGGVDQVLGTAAPAGAIRVDGTKLYVAVKDTTETDTSGWKEITPS